MNKTQFMNKYKDKPFLKYIEFIKYEGVEEPDCCETGMDINEFVENAVPHDRLSLFPPEHRTGVDFFLGYYRYLWFTTLINEWLNSDEMFYSRSCVIDLRRKMQKYEKHRLQSITFKFERYSDNSFTIDENNDFVMKKFVDAINNVFDELAVGYPDIFGTEPLRKTGKKSSYLARYIDSLYPFACYLKNDVFPDKPLEGDSGIYQLIIDTIDLGPVYFSFFKKQLLPPSEIIWDTIKNRLKLKPYNKLQIRI